MSAPLRFDPKPYIVSILLVFIAALLTLAMRPMFHGKSPLFMFLLAVILSAAYGGTATGLLATAVTLVLIRGWLYNDVVLVLAQSGVALFTIVSVAVSVLMGKLHTANAVLASAKERLEQQSRALSLSNEELRGFAYTLAHDIRSPLKSVSALTSLLVERNDGTMDERSKECARLIVGGVQRMESLTRGLLDYAVTVGDGTDAEPSDCNAVISSVLQDLRPEIEKTGARISADHLPEVQVHFSHISQLFSNLLSNALKYRAATRPEIEISVREEGQQCLICVRDNGIGFDMQHADEIFTMLKRLHGSGYEGNGIGLALCKTIVLRYGGKIWAESDPGKGSRFYFSLPKARKSPPPSFLTAITVSSDNFGASA